MTVLATHSGRLPRIQEIVDFKGAMAKHRATSCFMNAASSGMIFSFMQNDPDPTCDAYLVALADAMKAEYETIFAAGRDLQLDCPDLALRRLMLFVDLLDAEFVMFADAHVEALNHASSDISSDNARVLICWGNFESPHVWNIGMDTVFPSLMAANAGYLLFETSNARHAHEWTVYRDRWCEIPDDRVLDPGVVETATNIIEHPQLVAQRIERFTDNAGAERMIAGSDCGFGTFAGFGAVGPEIAYAKLGVIAEGAALATYE